MTLKKARIDSAKTSENSIKLVFFLVLIVTIFCRAPVILLEPRFWAEEGSLYFAHSLHSGLLNGIFFAPKVGGPAGYFLLVANIPTTLAAHFASVELAPFITTYFSLAVYLTVFCLILWGRSYCWHSLWQRATACLVVLFFPYADGTGETWLNTINLQVYCGLLALIIVLEKTSEVAILRAWLLRGLLSFCVLSGVYAVFLAPLFLMKWLWERSRESFIHLLIIGSGSVIQTVVFFYTKHYGLLSHKKIEHFYWAKSAVSVFAHQVIFPVFGKALAPLVLENAEFIGALRRLMVSESQYALLAGWTSLLLIFTLLWFLLRKGLNFIQSLLLLGFFLLALFTSIFSMGGVPGGRYAVLPSIVLGFLLLSVIIAEHHRSLQKSTAAVILLVALSTGFYDYWFNSKGFITGSQLPRPDWRAEVANWRQNPDYGLAMWPYPRWKASLPSPELISDFKHKLSFINSFQLESAGNWESFSILVDGLPIRFAFEFDVVANTAVTDGIVHVLLLGKMDKNMHWLPFKIKNLSRKQRQSIYVDSADMHKIGKLKLSRVDAVIIRFKSNTGPAAITFENFHYRSPFSVF